MLLDERDLGYLWDMREAVRDCIDFVEGASYEQFSADKMMHSAVERRLEILGEAASRVSEALQTDHPEIPWKEIKGLRVILAHRYDNLDLHQLWRAATMHSQQLLPNLNALLPNEDKV
ncbi:MAG TPA: HepT-like ribonuclease domain-containing protein [Pyrinomonadaceae bacterium]|jgi:uncharacterized protein with HEPN domain|nr:HepT-like ribonuclease domain-containing protein [Pyrinomonadaceae bacterium]